MTYNQKLLEHRKPHSCPTCGGLRLCPGIDGYGGKTTFPCPSCLGKGIVWG